MERTRVLVVDDSADMRASLKLLLEVLGYEAETARDGAAALALQHAQAFGVLITDIFMPGIEGMETIARFKAAWPGMRVIAMSGGGERTKRDYLSAALQIGADATMQKPFSVSTLISALARCHSVS
jgi:DNA-binding NtrC family response regulator